MKKEYNFVVFIISVLLISLGSGIYTGLRDRVNLLELKQKELDVQIKDMSQKCPFSKNTLGSYIAKCKEEPKSKEYKYTDDTILVFSEKNFTVGDLTKRLNQP